MKHFNILFCTFCILLLLLLSLPLALATDLSTDKAVYAPGETVEIFGSCLESPVTVAFQLGIGINTVWAEETVSGADSSYSQDYLPMSNGKYTLYAACKNEKAVSTTFCVGTDAECGIVPPAPPAPSGGSPGGSSSGGSYCSPKIQCEDYWSYCNATLKQSRMCVDLNNCKPSYKEEKNCTQCEVSWVCSLWSECKNGKQYRACVDSHYCQTDYLKPSLEKSCAQATAPGPAPAQVTKQIPPPAVSGTTEETFWNKYGWLTLGIVLALILIGAAVYFFYFHKKPKAYNIDELKGWIQQEKQAGTPDADIKQILAQQTGWRDDEISRAFRGLAA